jgi:ribose transport system substrate-binding protein
MDRRSFLKNSSITAAAAMLASHGLKPASAQGDQTYTMVTFLSGIDYWKDCYRGMQDAAEYLGVKTVYTGTPEFDITAEVRVLEETLAQQPTGILLTVANAEALQKPIDAAIDAGIPLVTFDADSPLSKRYSFVGTGNYYAGVVAARYIGPLVKSGKVGVVTRPSQGNLAQRTAGFRDTLKAEFKDVILEDSMIIDNEGSTTVTATKTSALLQAEPDLKGFFSTSAEAAVGVSQALREASKIADVSHIGFDYDEATLDLIDKGDLGATLAQGTWQMGFWGLLFAYMVRNNKIESVTDWKSAGISPLPPSVDTGVVVIQKDNSKFWRAAKK